MAFHPTATLSPEGHKESWDKLGSEHFDLVIIGGGYIGTELSGFLEGMGVETHLLVRKNRILRKFDPFITDAVTEELEKGGVNIHFNTSSKSFKRVDGGIEITFEDDTTAVFEKVLWVAGVTPNIEGLGLENTKVEVDDRGRIVSDAYECTTEDGVYAIGDVTGKLDLTPVAIRSRPSPVRSPLRREKRRPLGLRQCTDRRLQPSAHGHCGTYLKRRTGKIR